MRLAPEELRRCVASDSPRCGWYLFRISAPAETSGQGPPRASPGSFAASYVAFAHGCPRVCRLDLVTSSPLVSSCPFPTQRHLCEDAPHLMPCSYAALSVVLTTCF